MKNKKDKDASGPEISFTEELEKLRRENNELKEKVSVLQEQAVEAEVAYNDLRALLENIDQFIIFSDENAKIRIFNSNYAHIMKEFLGIDVKPGMQPHTYGPPEVQQYWENLHKRVLAGEKFTSSFTYPDSNMGIRYFEVSFNPIFDKDRVRGFSEVTREVTNEKKAEEELRRYEEKLEVLVRQRTEALENEIEQHKCSELALKESTERFRLIFEHAPLGIVQFDSHGVIIEVNQKLAELFNSSIEELLGFNIIEDTQDEEIRETIRQTLKGGISRIESEYPSNSDNKKIPLRVITGPIVQVDGKISGGLAILEDISSIKIAEQEMNKVTKLESLGIFAGGIAHDFNNLLTAIMGNLSLALLSISKEHEARDVLKNIKTASYKARDLTKQLLTFSKGGKPVKAVTSVASLLRETVDFILRGSSLGCFYSIAEDLWSADIDAGQISQVISNMVINARQAMPNGGIINITAENIDCFRADSLPLDEGNYILVSIQDKGQGIDKEHLDKIFDPYFTTKSKGSGLGLAVCYSIVKKHGGLITVESDAGNGTVFHIYLQASAENIIVSGEQKQVFNNYGKRVLVMDDDKTIIEMIGKMLSYMGFQVVSALHGEEAVDIYRRFLDAGTPFDVVIMDLTVPGKMGGVEAMEELKKIDASVTALVSSGYSNDAVMANYKKYGFKGVIAKPYSLDDVQQAVSSLFKK